jgi:5-methylcytosine-specific restriction protein A
VGILEMHKDENKNYQYALSDNIKKDYQKYIEKIAIDELFVKNNDLYDEYIEIKQDILSKFQRDKRNALAVIEQYGRQCFMDNGHESFDNLDNLKYVEVHHIIPFSLSDSLDTNLDVEGNLICLCPNCHKKMHYSNYESKKTMIDYI